MPQRTPKDIEDIDALLASLRAELLSCASYETQWQANEETRPDGEGYVESRLGTQRRLTVDIYKKVQSGARWVPQPFYD